MMSLSDIIEALNSDSRYLDDLLNIDTPYFAGRVTQMYPNELKLNKKLILLILKPHLDICIY